MSDILFRYLLFARQRENSWSRRLFLADENLLAAGVEQLVETAAARVLVKSQHERTSIEARVVPASRHRSVTFYDTPQPRPPVAPHFETRTDRFPLRQSLEIRRCRSCRGSGEVRCPSCAGRGKRSCSSCGGSGSVTRDNRRRRCSSCGGDGRRTCPVCRGRGRVRCRTCAGEGQVARWQEEVFEWLIEERQHDEIPPHGGDPVPQAFRRWLKIDSDRVASLEPATAAEHLSYQTPEAMEVITQTDVKRQDLEKEAQRSSDRYLFHRTYYSLTPLGYTVVRHRTKAQIFWLVGRGERAIEVAPNGAPDGVKWLGWLGAGSGGALSWEYFIHTSNLEFIGFYEHVGWLVDTPHEWLTAAAVSGFATLAGATRVASRPSPVQTLAVLPCVDRPTPWLTCLAYLGSYSERLRILDRNYNHHQAALRGAGDPGRQSRSLTLKLADGRQVRLVEVPNFLTLSQKQLDLMLEAVDGVLLLDDGTGEPDATMNRIQATVASPPVVIAPLVGGDDQPLSDAGAPLTLESIRHAFVTNFQDEMDWDALYQQLWQPVEQLLMETTAQNKSGAKK